MLAIFRAIEALTLPARRETQVAVRDVGLSDPSEVPMLHVASDAIVKIYRRGILRRTTPPSIDIAVDRWVHGYEPGSTVTLCGRKVATLHWRPFEALDFADVNDSYYCARCADVASR